LLVLFLENIPDNCQSSSRSYSAPSPTKMRQQPQRETEQEPFYFRLCDIRPGGPFQASPDCCPRRYCTHTRTATNPISSVGNQNDTSDEATSTGRRSMVDASEDAQANTSTQRSRGKPEAYTPFHCLCAANHPLSFPIFSVLYLLSKQIPPCESFKKFFIRLNLCVRIVQLIPAVFWKTSYTPPPEALFHLPWGVQRLPHGPWHSLSTYKEHG
jgi:hypothetical protein